MSRDARIVDVDIESIGTNVNIEQRIVGRERISEYIEKAHGILSEYEYQVFLLYIDGYSTAEISAKLCKDTKSVENAKLRMFKRLREVSNIFSDI